MIKIKDAVPLETLKDYGFQHRNGVWAYECGQQDEDFSIIEVLVGSNPDDIDGRNITLYISTHQEAIECDDLNCFNWDKLHYCDILFDLINDGLVERC